MEHDEKTYPNPDVFHTPKHKIEEKMDKEDFLAMLKDMQSRIGFDEMKKVEEKGDPPEKKDENLLGASLFEGKDASFFILDVERLAKALDYFFLSHSMTKKDPAELKEIAAIFYNALRGEAVAAEVYEGLYFASKSFEGFFNLSSFRRFLVKEIRLRYLPFYERKTNAHTGGTSYRLREEVRKRYGLSYEEGMSEFLRTLGISLSLPSKKERK